MKQLNDSPTIQKFRQETLEGLLSIPKCMDSKYFYDAQGDHIFQQIMSMPEYYPTRAEMEIFINQSNAISDALMAIGDDFDVIELGAGDATKSRYLLKELLDREVNFTYYPIDISQNIISYLRDELGSSMPAMQLKGMAGEYFDMLKKLSKNSSKPKVVLFLGSNIGNMPSEAALDFCRQLRSLLTSGDILLIGADLKKNPKIILDAYNDKAGITKSFNLNLLLRINRELDGNFNLDKFDHFPTYDPSTGECKSYLISLEDQVIHIGDARVQFDKHEAVYMEISRKFTIEDLKSLAEASDFRLQHNFYDHNSYFIDSLWIAE